MLSTSRKVALELSSCLTALFLIISTVSLNGQSCNSNLLANSGFESNLESWETNGTGTIAASIDANTGNQSMEIGGDGNRIYQTLPANQGQTFTLSASVKKLAGNGDANIGIKFLDGSYSLLTFEYAIIENPSDFVTINTISLSAPAQTAFIEITAFTNAASSAIRVDDFCLEVDGLGNGLRPDLTASNLRGDFFINAGDPFDLTFDLGNMGDQIAFGDLTVGVYISDDNQWEPSDFKAIDENYSNIPIGGLFDLTAVFTTPSTLAPGNHYLFVVVDINDEIIELNEDNNSTFRILEVGGLGPDPCAIEISIVNGSIACNDNDTPDDDTDDTWSFGLLPVNTLNADAFGWEAEINGLIYQGQYNEVTMISGLPISQGSLDILLTDSEDSNCQKEFQNLTPPAPCSNGTPPPPCDITATLVGNSIDCDDNNTPDNSDDDRWSFSLLVSNTNNLTTGWEVNINGQNFQGTYGNAQIINGLRINQGSIDLQIRDLEDGTCQDVISNIQPPAPCSNGTPPPPCDITATLVGNSIDCDDNNTPDDSDDDRWSFSLLVSNTNNLAIGWEANVNGQNFQGTYDNAQIINGLRINQGSIDLQIRDLEDGTCQDIISDIQPPAPCSNGTPPAPCDITATLVGNSIDCDDNNTPDDSDDDRWSFSLLVTNTSSLATGWEVNINGQNFQGTYGSAQIINDLLIIDGSIDLQVRDNEDGTCQDVLSNIQPPAPCSNVSPPPPPSSCVGNLLSNGNVENGLSEWNTFGNASISIDAFSGNSAIEISGNDTRILQTVAASEGVQYFLNAVAKKVGSGRNGVVGFKFLSNTYEPLSFNIYEVDNDDYNAINELSEIAPVGTEFIEVTAFTQPQGARLLIDDFCLTQQIAGPPATPDCAAYSLFPWADYIGKVKINEEGFSSSKSTYSDFRNIVFDIALEEPNQIELTANFSWKNFDEYFRVYIDFNQDRIYADDEIFYQGMIAAKPDGTEKNKLISGDFSINMPNALIGLTTLRVVMSRDDFAGPCGEIDFGEVEDYSVNVVNELDYNPYLTRSEFAADQLFAYPNPANEYLNIDLDSDFGKQGMLLVVDPLGRIVREKNMAELLEDTYRLSLEGFVPGIYSIYLNPDLGSPKRCKIIVLDEK